MIEKIKTDVDRQLSVFPMKKHFPIYYAKIGLFFYFVTKSSLSTSVFIYSKISQILETKYYVLWAQSWET